MIVNVQQSMLASAALDCDEIFVCFAGWTWEHGWFACYGQTDDKQARHGIKIKMEMAWGQWPPWDGSN